ncbi:MAG TPA: ATP-binding protein [Longimicrobium sp.]|nr:ATP-binding protein [Longimicrobium sp.]
MSDPTDSATGRSRPAHLPAGRAAVGGAVLFFGVFMAVWALRADARQPPSALYAAFFLPLYPLAALLAWRASDTPGLDARGRGAWRTLAAAAAVLGLNNVLFLLGRHFVPALGNPWIWLALLAVWYVLVFAALTALPRAIETGLERATFWLDAATVFVSGILVLLFVFSRTPGDSSLDSALSAATTVVVPALNGAVIFAALVVVLRPAHGVSTWAVGLLAASVAAMVVADLGYGRTALIGAHGGANWYDPLYMLASLLAVAAPQVQRERPGPPAAARTGSPVHSLSFLPYAAVAAVVLIVVLEVAAHENDLLGRLVLGAALLMVLIMSRQLIARRHVELLARRERANDVRFRSLIEHATDLTTIAARDGTIRYQTGSTRVVFGAPPDELVGRPLAGLAHPDDRERVAQAIAGSGAAPSPLRWRSRHPPGAERALESIVVDLSHVPAVGGIVLNTRDVTEQAALEMQLHQVQKLEAVGLLAGGIAHDFNNILAVIRASTELLEAAGDEPDARALEVREIRAAVERGILLARQLLAFARRDAIQVQRFDLGEAVLSMDGMLQRLVAGSLHLGLSVPGHPVPVLGDRGQIEQVVLNLAMNARDATPPGGRVEISVATRDGATAPASGGGSRHAVLAVRDTGHGMSREVRSRIFEPFFTTKPRGSGSGLGLSTVFAIVRRIGGTVSVQSAPGAGTTFEVVLPLAEGTPVPAPGEAARPAAAAGGHAARPDEVILVVDDEATLRHAVERYLSRLGYTVLTAGSGADALERIGDASLRIDLLLTDLTMPGMSGAELIAEAHERRPSLRVVTTSGFRAPHEGIPVPGGVVSEHVDKPFDLAALARTIRSALDAPREA